MAGAKDVLLKFLVDDRQKSKLKGIGDEAGKTDSKFKQLSGGAKAAVVGFAAIAATKVVGFLTDAAAAAMEDQAAQKQLELALQNTVGATDDQVAATEEWIDVTARQTGVADDELRPALAELVRTTGDLETAQETMGIAMDIATAKGVPLEAVTKAIGKAALGNVGSLGKMGVATKDASGEALTFEEVLAEAARTMGGATAVAADTAEGKMRRLQVAFDEAKESIGAFTIDGLGRMATGAQDIALHFGPESEAQKAIQLFTLHTGAAVDTAAAAITVMKDYGQSFADLAPHITLSTDELLKMRDADEDFLTSIGFTTEAIDEMKRTLEEELVTAAQTARDKGIHPLRTEVEEATTAMQDFETEVRSQVDPIFNLITSINGLEEAQANTALARERYGDGSAEHKEALRKETEAWMKLKDAQIRVQDETALTGDAYRTILEDMRIHTQTEIDIMVAEYDRANNYKWKPIPNRFLGNRGDAGRGPGIIAHSGGIVPGPRGADVPITAQAGEMIIPAGHTIGGGGSSTHVSLTVNALDPKTAGKVVVEALQDWQRKNGTIPVTTR